MGEKIATRQAYGKKLAALAEKYPELVVFDADHVQTLVAPGKKMKICTFLWVYYGYPSSSYEGISVESMRYNCGRALARRDTSGSSNSLSDSDSDGVRPAHIRSRDAYWGQRKLPRQTSCRGARCSRQTGFR